MKHTFKFSSLVLLLVLCCSWAVQSDDDLEFDDASGNFITVKEFRRLPAPLDTTFVKSEIKGPLFEAGQSKTPMRFHYTVEIKDTKIKNQYDLRVSAIPRTRDVAEILKYQGWSHYTMVIKNVKGKPALKSIKFLSAEI